MSVAQFILDIYFAIVLGIAAIAKVDNLTSFIHTLRYQYKIPKFGAEIIGKAFPWGEFFLAISLLIPAIPYRFIITCSILLVFIIFLASKIFLIKGNSFNSGCGCYGEITKRQNALQTILTLAIQIALAILLMIVTLLSPSLPWQCYLVSFVLLIGFYSWLLWKVWKRRQAFAVGNN